VYGQAVTFTATVTSTAGTPTGTVDFFSTIGGVKTPVGSSSLNGSGVATLPVNSLNPNAVAYSISASYEGDGNFASSNTATAAKLTVNKAATTTTVVTSATSIVYGQSVTFTATVAAKAPGAGTPSGFVNFFDGNTVLKTGVALVSGVATFTPTTPLAVTGAVHNITASYASGDSNFNTSASTAVGVTVTKATTIVGLNGSPNPSFYGQLVTFTANVAVLTGGGPAVGSVSFYDGALPGGKLLATVPVNASGQAVFSTKALSVASAAHTITASFSGNANYSASSTTFLQRVNKANTTVTIASSSPTSTETKSVTFTATVATAVSGGLGVPTGTVTFFVDGNQLGQPVLLNTAGQAAISTAALTVGQHAITATYNVGDANFNAGATAVPFVQTVNPLPPSQLVAGILGGGGVTVGTEFGIQVTAKNAKGVAIFDQDPVAFTVTLVPPGGTLTPSTMTVFFVNGVATFTGLKVNVSGKYTILITSGTLSLSYSIPVLGRQT
jgi:hypothetical protein